MNLPDTNFFSAAFHIWKRNPTIEDLILPFLKVKFTIFTENSTKDFPSENIFTVLKNVKMSLKDLQTSAIKCF